MFEMLHRIGIRGQNYMRGHTVESSGEVWVMNYIKRHLRDEGINKPVVFDVGANSGQYADVLLTVFGNEMECHSFEPASATFQALQQHFSHQPCVVPHALGLGKDNLELDLHFNHEGSTIASLYPIYDLEQQTKLTRQETISIRRLDDFCKERALARIDFLKIDVEGAELDVLLGATEMLADGKIRFVQFEFGPNNMSSRTYMKDFFQVLKGFKMYRICQDGIREIRYSEMLEIPLVSNFLAIRENPA
jgi:FkbM family methyltransferase